MSDEGIMLQLATYEPVLSPAELAVRDAFVVEYMKDFNAFQAALRCKFQPAFAVDWGPKLEKCPYVQRKIADAKIAASRLSDAQARALIENTLVAAMETGDTTASRVAASKAFAELRGFNKPDGDSLLDEARALLFRDIAANLPV